MSFVASHRRHNMRWWSMEDLERTVKASALVSDQPCDACLCLLNCPRRPEALISRRTPCRYCSRKLVHVVERGRNDAQQQGSRYHRAAHAATAVCLAQTSPSRIASLPAKKVRHIANTNPQTGIRACRRKISVPHPNTPLSTMCMPADDTQTSSAF